MDFSTLTTPVKVNALICFIDIQGFRSITQAVPDPLQIFDLLNGFARIPVAVAERTSGRVVKFIGDSCLLIYPEESADEGVQAIMTMKADCEAYLQSRGFSNKLQVTVHFGEIAVGLFGTGHCRGLDVMGDSVNTAATLEKSGHRGRLILSAQAFRKLAPPTRRLFHKFTEPVVYLGEE
jgi:class 3 adenylate cyclase